MTAQRKSPPAETTGEITRQRKLVLDARESCVNNFAIVGMAYIPSFPNAECRVLLALLAHRNHDTGRCDPSEDLLAEETRLSVDDVKRAKRALRKRGLVDWQKSKGGRGYRCQYTLPLFVHNGGNSAPLTQSTTGANLPPETGANLHPFRAINGGKFAPRTDNIKQTSKNKQCARAVARFGLEENIEGPIGDANALIVECFVRWKASPRTWKPIIKDSGVTHVYAALGYVLERSRNETVDNPLGLLRTAIKYGYGTEIQMPRAKHRTPLDIAEDELDQQIRAAGGDNRTALDEAEDDLDRRLRAAGGG
jgi:hypothetical protein